MHGLNICCNVALTPNLNLFNIDVLVYLMLNYLKRIEIRILIHSYLVCMSFIALSNKMTALIGLTCMHLIG